MRIIDADKLISRIKPMCGAFLEGSFMIDYQRALSIIADTPTITTKQIKYYDEDEKVWKIGEVIVDE